MSSIASITGHNNNFRPDVLITDHEPIIFTAIDTLNPPIIPTVKKIINIYMVLTLCQAQF